MKLYIQLGMRRSGLHAVGNWIRRQHGDLTYYSDTRFAGDKLTGSVACRGRTGMFIGFEDFDVRDWERNRLSDWIGRFEHVYSMVVMRDVRNWLASSFKAHLSNSANIPWRRRLIENLGGREGRIARWTWLMGEYLGRGLVSDIVPISFNKWFIDKGYRQRLAEQLGLSFTDVGKEEIVHNGAGSSFDLLRFNGRASEMDVLNRWKAYESDPQYTALLTEYREAVALSDLHLGTPGDWR